MSNLLKWIMLGSISIFLMIAPNFLEPYQLQLFILLFINILLAQSINLLSGYTGLMSIGHAGFFAIGSYTSAVLMIHLSLPFIITIFLAVVVSMFFGWVLSIPAGRVSEFYLALMTLGFGLIIEVITKEWGILGGFSGLSNVPSPILMNLNIFGINITVNSYYYLTFFVLVTITIFIKRVIQSYVGRTMLAVKTNEIVALSMGINSGNVKKFSFILSAGIAGVAGVLYAHYISFLSYEQFSIMKSISILAMAIIGGLGTLIGPFFGAIFETWLPELLQSFERYQLLIYGILLVSVIRFFPKGLAGILKYKESYISLPKVSVDKLLKENKTKSSDRFTIKNKYSNWNGKGEFFEINNISKAFGGHKVLEDVSMNVNSGEIHGLIGPNGAGKSTLVNIITGAYKVDQGNVKYLNNDITNFSLHENARNGIVRIFQDPRIISEATVLENVLLGAQIDVTRKKNFKLKPFIQSETERKWIEKASYAINLCGLQGYTMKEAGTLPYGTRRLIEVARAIVAKPQVLILDEPAAGLSETETNRLKELLLGLKKQGMSIIVIEHDMDFILELIDSVTVLDYGKVIYQGNVEDMKKNEKVIEAYLGVV